MPEEAKNSIIKDLTCHLRLNVKFYTWMGFLSFVLVACLWAYSIQIKKGLGVTGLRDFISWGMYISNFVFFVASSLIGMLISAVLGLIGQKWITPIARIAEVIAIAFAAVAGLVIVSDMGRPERLAYVFIYGRFQSPILWDVSVVVTYVVISFLLFYIPLLPDLAICKNLEGLPKWQKRLYGVLSLGWTGNQKQRDIISETIRILLILIIPLALAIHTVTSWLFATNPRAGWDSTIFGPYFVSGAFVAGTAAVIIAMYFFRKNYKLKDYISDMHFDKMGKLLVLVSLVYLYFNMNELLVPGYKLKLHEATHLHELMAGQFAPLFWGVNILGLILPIVLLLFKAIRKPLPMVIISIFVIVGAWFKRYLIVVPTQTHPYLPIQYVPKDFVHYAPTLIETAITGASFILVLMIISVLTKLFPVIPIEETIRETN